MKKFADFFPKILWVLPFLFFCVGYFCVQFFVTETTVQTPDLIGKDLLHATKICCEQKLNLRIIAEKEVADTKPGTIIKQNPRPQASIKTHQSIFITITKQPIPVVCPNFIDKSQEQIEKICKDKGIKNRFYFLPTKFPAGKCCGQIPLAGQILEDKKMSCYISTGNQNQYLFPDFTHHQLHDVINFLEQHHMEYEIFYKDQKLARPYKQNYIVSYQKPLAGTLVSPNNKLQVQLKVQ